MVGLFATFVGLSLSSALPVSAAEAFAGKEIDCYCTDTSGARVELGVSICLFVDGRNFTARCEMAGNVPFWRETATGCASSALRAPQPVYPVFRTRAVDPEI